MTLDRTMQNRMMDVLKDLAGDNWRVTTDAGLVKIQVGPKAGIAVYLTRDAFTAKQALARKILNDALLEVQRPKKSRRSFTFTSLRSGKRIAISIMELRYLQETTERSEQAFVGTASPFMDDQGY